MTGARLTEHSFELADISLPYLLSLPDHPGSGHKTLYPLIFFLHGAGERGYNLDRIRHYGIPKATSRPDFPFITVSPQCPARSYWEDIDSILFALLDDVLARYPVDPARVYLTGLSMGGHGAWVLGLEQPGRFAALAPVCAPFPNLRRIHQRIVALKDTPIWVFHGAKDDVVPVEHSDQMVKILRALDSNVRYTVYPNAKHDCWKLAYADPALYNWFLDQHLDRV